MAAAGLKKTGGGAALGAEESPAEGPGRPRMDGGAISAASGSLDVFPRARGAMRAATGSSAAGAALNVGAADADVGGGGGGAESIGFSTCSSPGKTQRFFTGSKYASISLPTFASAASG